MTPIQQLMLGVGAKKKTYVDDVFSTYLYTGTGSTRSINTSVDMSKGGLVWIKDRDASVDHNLYDTVRGVGKYISSNLSDAEDTSSPRLNAFNSNGFGLGGNSAVNGSGTNFSSYSFRKAPGFCDIVKFVGDGSSSRTISHNLGCKPGLILFKNLDTSIFWAVWHKDLKYLDTGGSDDQHAKGNYLRLNENVAGDRATDLWPAEPTATNFTVGYQWAVNENTKNIVAYLFAGGESSASEAVSVDFDGSSDYMNTPASSDFAFGSNPFTIECWVKSDDTSQNGGFFNIGGGTGIGNQTTIAAAWNGSNWTIYAGSAGTQTASSNYKMNKGQWYHVAYVKSGTTTKLYVDGIQAITCTDNDVFSTNWALAVGAYSSTSNTFNGKISNLRVVKGTALYTAAFKPPTEPLTNITNTTMLCCNNSSTTGKTVGPSLTAWGTVTASTDSPFDDPAAFTFGDAGDQGVVKCGSYTSDSNEDANLYLGWEPQWVLGKRIDSSTGGDWFIIDSMRGFMNAQDTEANNGGSKYVEPNTSDAESNTSRMGLTSTGFYHDQFGANREFIYMAIRRQDGYVGKPVEDATKVFAMDAGNSSTTQGFTSGFPVDFALDKKTSATSNWEVTGRMIQEKYLLTNSTNAEATYNKFTFDDMTGWNTHDGYDSVWQSWMWKRHAGFDVVTYAGVSGTQTRGHSLGVTPEMIWVKCRTGGSDDWCVGHKDLTGGFTGSILYLNGNDAEVTSNQFAIAPTSTHWSTASGGLTNNNGGKYLAMLFASVKGVSHCGTFTGNGSTQTITIPNGGFQPRFLIMKCISHAVDWQVLDTTRGWASGNDPYLELNTTAAQYTTNNFGEPTSTGFTLNENAGFNGSGRSYIYYAHA